MKKFFVIICVIMLALSMVSCTNSDTNSSTSTSVPTSDPDLEQGKPDTKPEQTMPPVDTTNAVKIKFDQNSISAGEGVTVNGNKATITAAGNYEVSGELKDGQLCVEADDCKVYLILNNAKIHCSNSAPLFVKKADHVYLVLASGSVNTLTDGSVYSYEAGVTEPDATLFSKADMTISGEGTLNVNSKYNDSIANRDTLVIESGNINVNAANHGIKGKDFLSILGGNVKITSGRDGIKSTNDTDSSLGYVIISGGVIDINAQDEAVSAVTSVKITGGKIKIATENNAVKAGNAVEISGGEVNISTKDKDIVSTEEKIGKNANVTVNGSKLKSNY